MRMTLIAAAAALAPLMASAPAAEAQEKYIGEVFLAGFNFCPRGSMAAAGQLLDIASNSALFSLYGTIYGGDGRTTFALPDLRGRAPVASGQGPALSNLPIGAQGGRETTTLSVGNLPPHDHAVTATLHGTTTPASTPNPTGALPALTTSGSAYAQVPAGGATVAMEASAITAATANTGGGQSFETRSPYLAMTWCVATFGIYPSRS